VTGAGARAGWAARFLAALVLAAVLAGVSLSAQAPSRAKATATGTRQFHGAAYVDARVWAARYGLKPTWIEAGRQLQLASSFTRILIEFDRRELTLNGLRLFLGEPVVAHGGSLWISDIDARTLLGPILRPAGAARPPPALRVICLDPGHGGNDTGTRNTARRLDEKAMTLDVARRLKPLLEARGYTVVLTRTDDRFIELEERAEIANRAGADLFLSLHFNAFPQPGVHGTETYLLTRRTQRSTGSARREPSDGAVLPGNAMDEWNAVLAYAMHRQLLTRLRTFDRGMKFARFKVLTLVRMPAVLLEFGYLSNEAEARRIATPGHREEIARTVAAGVDAYARQAVAGRPER
jgi:N-acetylmuramoyl-L-alanine amidase